MANNKILTTHTRGYVLIVVYKICIFNGQIHPLVKKEDTGWRISYFETAASTNKEGFSLDSISN